MPSPLRDLIVVAVVCLMPAVLAAQEADEKEKLADLAGSYKCSGTSNGGGKYEGTVEVTQSGDAYRVEWDIAGEKHAGIGIYDKDKDLLSTSWALSVEGGIVTGVAVYTIEKDKLTGRWAAFPGDGKIYDEVWTRVY